MMARTTNLACVLWCGALAGIMATGCSLQTATRVQCQQNTHCRAAFGPGAVCDTDGSCRFATADSRCQHAYPDDLVSAPELYAGWEVVGGFFDLSQPVQQAMANALLLASREYDQARDSGDPEIGVVICGTEGQEQAAAQVTAYLTTELDAAVVVGGTGSRDVTAAFGSTAPAGALLISPWATTTELWSIDTAAPTNGAPGVLWRTVPPDATQARALVVDLRSPGVGRAQAVENLGILYETTPFGRGLAHEVETLMYASGGSVEAREFVAGDETSITSAAVTLAADPTLEETLLVATDVADLEVFSSVWTLQMGDRPLLLPHTLADADAIRAIDEPMRDLVRGTRLRRPSSTAFDTFAAAFTDAYAGQTAAYHVFEGSLAYDAGWLAIYGLAWAYLQGRDATGERAAEGLRHTVSGADIPLGPASWPDLKGHFAAGLPVNLQGASGTLDYDLTTEELSGQFEIWQVGVCSEECVARLYNWPP